MVILEFASGTLAFTMKQSLILEEKPPDETMQETLCSNNLADIQAWNVMQSTLKCCGIRNYTDWPDIPSSSISQLVYGVRSNLRAEPYEYFLQKKGTIYIHNIAIAIFVLSLLWLAAYIIFTIKEGQEGGLLITLVLITIVIPEFAWVILSITMKRTLIREENHQILTIKMEKTLHSNNTGDVQAWNAMQSTLKCCGVTNHSDWPVTPSSCCEGSPPQCPESSAYGFPC
ncbi:unnamed protein product [Darwinula stevensoni]|uniref:Tetraspanin n=1 Tax=Darwinula stevensoni TaxID=69355 RepID=A0A7R9A8B1_9CRUS|nr:unnamed protein product [Darwinula stevensoni]CAG0896190.1 unnamed protein product [Darwinula stevensoni]